jgi:hypothetical protein
MGNLEEGSSTRDFERWRKEVLGMELVSEEAPWWGPRGGSFFTGDPGRYGRIGSRYGHLYPWRPLSSRGELGNRRGAHIPGTLKDE